MDSFHNTEPDGTTTPMSDEQQHAIEAMVARYQHLLSEAQEARRDWARIFDAIEDPICVVTADYRLIHTNAAYLRVFGNASVHGGQHYCFSANGDNGADVEAGPCAECPLPETVRTRRAGVTQQVWWSPGKAGEVPGSRVYQRWTYPIVNADGTVGRVVEVIKDVTDQERMRRAVTKTEALREADRLKAELLGTVSHELRSPLAAIKGYAATLLRHGHRLPREERREFLEAIGEASDRLEVIINRLLEMSQLEIGSIMPHLAPVDVAYVAREAIAAAEQRASTGTSSHHMFNLRLPRGNGGTGHTARVISPVIDADARLLRDALDNLLENAIKYSPEGGSIDVTLELRPAGGLTGAPVASGEREGIDATDATDGTAHAAGAGPPEMLEIVVRDTGMGIPAEHLGRVFERFHRVDTRLTREVDGLGLGLAMCKRIAELHGGSIWAESSPGAGSAFHLLLPLVASRMINQTLIPVS